MKKIGFIIAAAVFLTTCGNQVVPLTGRKQFNIVSNTEIFPLSFNQYKQVLVKNKVETKTARALQLKRVGARIQVAVERYFAQQGQKDLLYGYKWEFNLIESREMNAWCMPGGKVAFFTGILPVCKDEAGIAVVMGHEIGHALANHGAERMSQQKLAQYGAIIGGVAIQSDQWRGMFNQLYSPVAGLTILSYSRKQELEADKIGLYVMAMAGYDPREAPGFWNRMIQKTADNDRSPQFLSTHPDPSGRIADINKEMSTALQYYAQATGKPVSTFSE